MYIYVQIIIIKIYLGLNYIILIHAPDYAVKYR